MNEDVTLAKWLNNELTDSELQGFVSQPEYATYSKIKEFSAQLTVPQADMDALYQNIERNKNKDRQTKVRQLNPWMARIAAVLVLALGATFFFYTTHTTTQLAAAGERDSFMLPDNSEVVLNAGSEAEYREWNWGGNRTVELNGEAYFKVAKGKMFDVVTPLGTVTVIGTQFNVKARNGRLDVSCFEGKVRVISGNNVTLLTPGKIIAFENGKQLPLKPVVEGTKPGWINYETSFNSESLQNVISEMERQYKMTITLDASAPKKPSPFSGTLKMNNIDSALDNIQMIYQLKSKKEGNTIILSSE